MTEEAPRLPGRAEALLAKLGESAGLVDSSEEELDARARRIDDRVTSVAIGSTDDALLEPPKLEKEAGEPAEDLAERKRSSQPREASATSLADLARSVARKPGRAESSSLVKQSLSVAALARANLPTSPRAPGPSSSASDGASPPAPPPPPSQQPAPARASVAAPARSALIPFFAGAAVAIAAAATVALALRPPVGDAPVKSAEQPRSAPAVVAAPAAQEPVAPAPAAPVEARALAEAPATPPATPAGAAPPGVVANERRLERATPVVSSPVAATKPAPAAAAPAPGARVASRKGSAPEERVVLEESEPPSPPHPGESALRPASGTTSTPDRPSAGAVQAALGTVLSAARACVAGAGTSSSASVVFSSSGSVARVSVSGPAAGTPAGGCIQSALSRARVAPFTQPTYVVSGISIRP